MRVIVVTTDDGELLKVFADTRRGRETFREWLDRSAWERYEVNVNDGKVWGNTDE